MADYNYRNREKENAKEWQIKEEAGVQKGNVHSYFNEWVDEDQTSESAGEDPAVSHTQHPSASVAPRSRPPPRNLNQLQKVNYKKPFDNAKHKQVITFARKRDNAARAAYRAGQPPSVIIDLGRPLTEIEPSVARIQRTFEEIGVRFGSFILPERSLKDTKISIWGGRKPTDDTVTELRQWRSHARARQRIQESRPSGKDNFARIFSIIGDSWAAEEKTAKRDAERQHYQKAPQQGQKFKSNGYYLWPNSEIRAIDLFGPHCEALDTLRIEHRVYINFDEARSIFKVHSNSGAERVNEVVQRIENTIKEYVARDHRPVTLHLVEPPSPPDHRPNVQTVAGPFLGVKQARSKIPILDGEKLAPDDTTDLEQEAENSMSRNKSWTYGATQKVLERIPYYRGYLRMRINFGTFALVKFQWPPGVSSVTLEKFAADIQLPGTKGTLIRNIGSDRTPQDILERCRQAGDLFQAVSTSEQSLADVPPQYVAMIYLRHPEKIEEMVQLEVTFTANNAKDKAFEGSKALWTKGGKPDATTQAPPLEVFHIRLHSGISWQLQISMENTIDISRITPRMEEFARGVRFKEPPADENPAISGYKVFTSPRTLPIIGMEQKTTFRYSLKAQPSCILELSRYDEYNGTDPRYPSSTQWAASFYDRDWDVKFSENAGLGVGQSASWNPQTEPFFRAWNASTSKAPHAGFTDVFRQVQAVASFLDKLKGTLSDPNVASATNEISQETAFESEVTSE
ncbi:MAG: hypothetical protein LQ343_004541 [Gyalolechia ehrenbergii]|nr:MAG: hypothetical protein LQ343_004541 [Gyalolechia ehrenbergii]